MNVEKPRILIAASIYSHIQAFHIPFIKFMRDKGYEVHVAANAKFGNMGEVEKFGAVCWDVPFSRAPISKTNIAAYREIKKIFQMHDYKFVHVHTPVASMIVRYVAKKFSKSKVFYTAHGFHFFKGAPKVNWLLYYPMEKMAARWTDTLFVINSEDYEQGKKLGFQAGKDLFLLPGVGIDIPYYRNSWSKVNDVRQSLNIPNDHIVFSCIAELNNNKNQKYLLQAWERISREYPKVHLLLSGDGPNKTSYEKFIAANKLERVYLLGFRKDIPQIINESDIVTLVSKREGLPRCIMEAMACGKAIIASNIRGCRDLIEDGVSGYLVNPMNVSDFISKSKILIEQPGYRINVGLNALEKIRAYSNENVLEDMERAIIQLMEDNV